MKGMMNAGKNVAVSSKGVSDPKATIKRLMSYLKPHKFLFIFSIALALASTLFTVLGPSVLGRATTEIFNGFERMMQGTGTIDLSYVARVLIVLLCIYIIAQAFMFLHNFFISKVSQKTMQKLRDDVDEKINRMPLNYFDTNTHGEILSRITNDVETISGTFQQIITQLLTGAALIIGIIIMMLTINIWLTLIAFVAIPLTGIASKIIMKRSQKYFVGNQKTIGKMNGYVEEYFGGHNIVSLFNKQKDSKEEFRAINKELYGYNVKSQFFSSIMMPVVHALSNTGYVFTVGTAAMFAINGMITVGNIQAFIQYTRQFQQPLNQMAQLVNVLQSTLAAAERVFEVVDEIEQPAETPKPTTLNNVRGEVTFDNVNFGYSADNILIKNFNLHVKPGQKIAVVGPTGAGKSTLINLLMRFYDVTSGSIKVDGVNIMDMTRDGLHDIFGMVLQDTWLFEGSIRDNIAYGGDNVTDEQVQNAAKLACASHFIKTLPDGYNMRLTEDASNISGGQKQLLTIARAIISDPKILILDEATSSVDTRTELLIQKAMLNLMENRTSFVIAHRLSTIKDSDLILVINNGNIVEQGTHDDLIAQCGFYEKLYNSQFAK